MKTEEIKKQEELNDEQLDNVAGASKLKDLIKKAIEISKEAGDAADDAAEE